MVTGSGSPNPPERPLPERELEEFKAQIWQTRIMLERTHEGLLALLGHQELLRYGDVRELIRGIDQQISALQQSLITLRDTLAALS